MADASSTGSLAHQLARGLEHLKAGRANEAVIDLEVVCRDRSFARSEALKDLRARALSLLAQALLDAGRPAEARAPVDAAHRLASQLGDTEGIQTIEALRNQIVAASGPASGGAVAPEGTLDAAIHAAVLAFDAGDGDGAVTQLERVLERAAGDVRATVLARLQLARTQPDRARQHVDLALACADAADDFNLVGMVARTAALLGVPLAPHVLPGRKGEGT